MHPSRIPALAVLCLSLALPIFGARSLHWSELAVEAWLDTRGAMNVWNARR